MNFFLNDNKNFVFKLLISKKNLTNITLKRNYSAHSTIVKKNKIILQNKTAPFYCFKLVSSTKQKNKQLFLNIKHFKNLKIAPPQKFNKNNNKQINMSGLSSSTKLSIKYSYVISHIFKKIFKNTVKVINFNYFLKTKIKNFSKLVKDLQFKNKFFKKTIVVYKILKIIFASLLFKDSKLAVYAIKEMFEKIHYSKHKIYFIFWRNLLKVFLKNFYKKLKIYGIKLEFHGKLGVGGNSKKRSNYFIVGRCSNSTKFFKIDTTNSFFRTKTGVVGFTYSIFY